MEEHAAAWESHLSVAAGVYNSVVNVQSVLSDFLNYFVVDTQTRPCSESLLALGLCKDLLLSIFQIKTFKHKTHKEPKKSDMVFNLYTSRAERISYCFKYKIKCFKIENILKYKTIYSFDADKIY